MKNNLLKDLIYTESMLHQIYTHNKPILYQPLSVILQDGQYLKHAPTALIFHTGRCGSTLICNALSKGNEHIRIIKEYHVINQLLLQLLQISDYDPHTTKQWLKSILFLICNRYSNFHLIFKFSSWNVLHAKYIIEIFPSVPVIMLWREKSKVVESQMLAQPFWAKGKPTTKYYNQNWDTVINAAHNQLSKALWIDYETFCKEAMICLEKCAIHTGLTLNLSNAIQTFQQYSKCFTPIRI